MCGNRKLFVHLDETIGGAVTFGDLSKVEVKGRGRILIKLKNGSSEYITDVYFVLKMKTNILSIGQLLEKGYCVVMADSKLVLRDNFGRLITAVPMTRNRMFLLQIQVAPPSDICLNSTAATEDFLGHRRFGHLHFDALSKLVKERMVQGLPQLSFKVQHLCEACLLEKQTRSKFLHRSDYHATGILDVVYSDVCGPFQVASFGGAPTSAIHLAVAALLGASLMAISAFFIHKRSVDKILDRLIEIGDQKGQKASSKGVKVGKEGEEEVDKEEDNEGFGFDEDEEMIDGKMWQQSVSRSLDENALRGYSRSSPAPYAGLSNHTWIGDVKPRREKTHGAAASKEKLNPNPNGFTPLEMGRRNGWPLELGLNVSISFSL
ncbi:hypothetical protein Dimus_013837 [Dionaea muscipula]